MENFQGKVLILIKQQILIINLKGNVWQPEGRIDNRILEVKGLRYKIMRPCFGLKKVFACCRHVIILSL